MTDWDAELKKIDKQMESMSDAALIPAPARGAPPAVRAAVAAERETTRTWPAFLRLALEMQAPIVPVAVIGAEEQAPAFNVRPLARLLRTPSFPVVPYPPFLPLVPLPVKYRLYFGEPMRFTGDPDDDEDILDDKVKTVKNRIQSMIQLGLREREHVFW